MEKLTLNNIERYITLNNELAILDPYVLNMTKEEFLAENKDKLEMEKDIFVLNCDGEDIGFAEFSKDADTSAIEKIYVKNKYDYNKYKNILEFAHNYYFDIGLKKIKLTELNDKTDLIKALKETGYIIGKEHIQMEKSICDLHKQNSVINCKTFYEIREEKWVYDFVKECMEGSVLSYNEDEISELAHINSDTVFVFYNGTQPIGFIISYINEKRNKQEGKNVIYIEEIAVLKNFRSKGYGQKVIELVLDKGKNYGMDTARLHVYRHNENAYRLYKKLGFNEVKSIGYWTRDLAYNK